MKLMSSGGLGEGGGGAEPSDTKKKVFSRNKQS